MSTVELDSTFYHRLYLHYFECLKDKTIAVRCTLALCLEAEGTVMSCNGSFMLPLCTNMDLYAFKGIIVTALPLSWNGY